MRKVVVCLVGAYDSGSGVEPAVSRRLVPLLKIREP